MKLDLNDLLKAGEGLNCEFKRSFNKGVADTLCAFANTKGGIVIIGVNDDGLPTGTDLNTETLQTWVNEIKQNTYPTIIADADEFIIENKKIATLTIDEFPVKPVSSRGKYYKRIKNSNHQMSLSEVSNMHIKTFNSSWDYYEDPNHTLDDISLDKVNNFIKKTNMYRLNKITDDPLTALKKYELLKNDKITNAAYLLFAKNDTLATCIEIGRFANDKITIKDALTLKSDIFTEIEQLMNFILKHINKRYEFDGSIQRKEIWDYPIEALREIIINMVVHRDYMHNGDSSVKIYDDKIEFFNPGHLPESITQENLENNDYISECRNKQIASILKDSHDMEKYGTGIYRVGQKFDAHGLISPTFKNFQHGIKVTVLLEKKGIHNREYYTINERKVTYNPENYLINKKKVTHNTKNYPCKQQKEAYKQQKEPIKTNKVTYKSITHTHNTPKVTYKTPQKILLLLKNNPTMTRTELMQELSLSMSGIKKSISNLQKKGLLKREGSRKTGKWVVTNNLPGDFFTRNTTT